MNASQRSPASKTLQELYLDHHGKVSDKWSSYLVEYDRIFAEYRRRHVRLLEIGVQNGGSLEIWAQYFRRARSLIGCDIDARCAELRYDDPRVVVVVGDANSDETEQQILNHAQEFEIIIDDGSHRSGDIIRSFARYFPHVTEGGVYIVEDLHCSYWQEFGGGLYHPFSAISYFKRLLDILNHEHWGVDKTRAEVVEGFASQYGASVTDDVLKAIHSIYFADSFCAIRKAGSARKLPNSRVVAGSTALVDGSPIEALERHPHGVDQQNNGWTNRSMPPDEELSIRLEELADLSAGAAHRQDIIDNLSAEAAHRQDIIDNLAAEAAHRQDVIDNLAAEAAHRQDVIDHLAAEAAHRLNVIQQVITQRDDAISAAIAAEANLTALSSSRSWKVTAPMRTFRRLVGRVSFRRFRGPDAP